MGIRFGATVIGMGVLLALGVGPAKADTYHATGQTDFAACASINMGCSSISYNLDFTTDPAVLDSKPSGNVFLFVSSVFGDVNGVAVSCTRPSTWPACGDLLAAHGNYFSGPPIPDGSIVMLMNGNQVGLSGGPDSFVGGAFGFDRVGLSLDSSKAVATWNIVSTPEPSTLQFLSIGLLGLMGLTLLKNRFR
jgi:hypothetical protein